MADENMAGQGWPPEPNKPIGTGEGEVPLATPPEPKIDLRTMASDLDSLKESGGGAPRPYTPPPQIPKQETSGMPPTFEPPKIENAGVPPAPFPTPVSKTRSKKGLFWGLLALLVVLGLAAAGYFYVYPHFFAAPQAVTETTTPPAAAPAAQPTAPAVTPSLPSAPTETTSTATTTPQAPALPNHVSLFKTAADATADVTLSSTDIAGFQAAVPFNQADVAVFKEIVPKDSKGNILILDQIMSMLLPNDLSSDVLKNFNPDMTVFVYTDKTGSWPGLILGASQTANLPDLQTKIGQEIEAAAHLTNLFLTNPGAVGTTWKSGSTSGIQNRYLSFGTAGFALNYGWVGQNLLISSSYTGFKEAIKRLQ